MKTKPWLTLLIVLGVLALVPVAARADVLTDITPGTAAPPATLGGYTMTPFPADPQPAGGTLVASVASPLGGPVVFGSPMSHFKIGAGWATWSHGYTGDVYYTGGPTSASMKLPTGTRAFYFYAEPNPFQSFTMTATGTDGVVSASVSQAVSGASGAKYFGFYTTGPPDLASISISSSVDFAVGEFGIQAVPEPSSMALLALGTLGLVAWRRKQV